MLLVMILLSAIVGLEVMCVLDEPLEVGSVEVVMCEALVVALVAVEGGLLELMVVAMVLGLVRDFETLLFFLPILVRPAEMSSWHLRINRLQRSMIQYDEQLF